MTHRFLTEPEAAEILRCSTTKVKRLRLSGQLAYLPGRPVLIDEADLAAFIEGQKRVANPAPKPQGGESVEAAKKWALQAVLLKRDRRKS
jgi:hypothetical protein